MKLFPRPVLTLFLVFILFQGVLLNDSALAQTLDPEIYSPPRVSVTPMSLSTAPDDLELMSAGQLGGILYPVYSEVSQARLTGRARSTTMGDEQNISFGKAIQQWNAHEWISAAEGFKEHIEQFPNSPWKAEAEIHLACPSGKLNRIGIIDNYPQPMKDSSYVNSSPSHHICTLFAKVSASIGC